MGWNDYLNPNDFSFVTRCVKCQKLFKVYTEEQIAGFRMEEDLICPYCGNVCGKSMEYEFYTEKIEEGKKQ